MPPCTVLYEATSSSGRWRLKHEVTTVRTAARHFSASTAASNPIDVGLQSTTTNSQAVGAWKMSQRRMHRMMLFINKWYMQSKTTTEKCQVLNFSLILLQQRFVDWGWCNCTKSAHVCISRLKSGRVSYCKNKKMESSTSRIADILLTKSLLKLWAVNQTLRTPDNPKF